MRYGGVIQEIPLLSRARRPDGHPAEAGSPDRPDSDVLSSVVL